MNFRFTFATVLTKTKHKYNLIDINSNIFHNAMLSINLSHITNLIKIINDTTVDVVFNRIYLAMTPNLLEREIGRAHV